MPLNHDRAPLRRKLREQRRAIPPAERIAAADQLAVHLLNLPFLPESGHVAGYWATDGEIGLHSFQIRLPPRLTYCLPVLHAGMLRFAPWRSGDALTTNQYGIPEPVLDTNALIDPKAMALVIVPLVGFDAQGNRLGMGGGWYDRSFAFRKNDPPPPWLVGVGFAAQEIESLDTASWDVRVDAVYTEQTILSQIPAIQR